MWAAAGVDGAFDRVAFGGAFLTFPDRPGLGSCISAAQCLLRGFGEIGEFRGQLAQFVVAHLAIMLGESLCHSRMGSACMGSIVTLIR